MKKNIFNSLTKRSKALLLDFVLLAGMTELFLFLFNLIFTAVHFDWRHYVALPVYFIFFYFAISIATKQNKTMWEYSSSKVFLMLFLNLLGSTVITFLLSMATFGLKTFTVRWQAFAMFLLFLVNYTALFAAHRYLKKRETTV